VIPSKKEHALPPSNNLSTWQQLVNLREIRAFFRETCQLPGNTSIMSEKAVAFARGELASAGGLRSPQRYHPMPCQHAMFAKLPTSNSPLPTRMPPPSTAVDRPGRDTIIRRAPVRLRAASVGWIDDGTLGSRQAAAESVNCAGRLCRRFGYNRLFKRSAVDCSRQPKAGACCCRAAGRPTGFGEVRKNCRFDEARR
jgi:hypothetical protein